ncbi:D-beta-hydroxybutyrate dehydrogenase-like isoform X4 [Haliotis cracherodii]|uniref:D-beta-hydroxybutyrate dehydrogenase-like isoform X4 n=1 Tax=Haliotis cracherodii TaxID=6455 RepID=UPI0039EBE1AF
MSVALQDNTKCRAEDMDGKVALVTGSTTGIGLGIANHLAEKGCSIILTGLGSQELINSILEDFKKYKGRVDYVPADLIDPVSIATFCDKVCDIHPDGVDILVNNAGIQYVRAVEDYPLEKWNEMIAITMTAPFLLTKHFLSRMKQKGWGRIINMSSQMAVISTQGKAPYSAAKAGLVGFTKGVALEAAEYGVTCNAICPGFVDAPMAIRQMDDLSREKGISFQAAREHFTNAHPTKKAVTVAEVCGLVDFLCTSSADNMTASAILMDGGNVAH